jgi:Uncharacterised nucleotidyltransferase
MPSYQAERQVILLSAGMAARRQSMREQARQLLLEVEWPRLAETLRRRRLLTVLGPRIVELAEEGSVSGGFAETRESARDTFAKAVEQALEAGRRRGTLLQLVSLRIVAMLADAGIRCAPLKGPLLGEAIYGDPGRRLSGDIDLLVAPEQLQAAVEVVRELGYGAPTDYVQECGLPLLHFVLTHERGELPPVELHWRVHWYERAFACERLLAPVGDVADDWRPAPADELAALLLFYARDGFVGLRLATDLGAWWDVHGADLPAGALVELLGAYPALARVIPSAVCAAEKVVGLPAERIIGSARKLSLRELVAVRLANPNPRSSQSQLYADMGLVDGLLAPAGGFGAFVRRQLLPAPEVLDQQAEHGAKQRARPRLARFLGVLARYVLRMTSLIRAPEMAS